jgi:rhamnose utilization protein RhaD (predicted bifunctional aldolase and dehydrogenase)
MKRILSMVLIASIMSTQSFAVTKVAEYEAIKNIGSVEEAISYIEQNEEQILAAEKNLASEISLEKTSSKKRDRLLRRLARGNIRAIKHMEKQIDSSEEDVEIKNARKKEYAKEMTNSLPKLADEIIASGGVLKFIETNKERIRQNLAKHTDKSTQRFPASDPLCNVWIFGGLGLVTLFFALGLAPLAIATFGVLIFPGGLVLSAVLGVCWD